ncbi:MAG: hypothetical protein ACRDYV_07310, partial [Acidimicrobiia bacterium]
TFEISPDERHLIAIGQDTLVFRTDDPDDVQRLPRELAGATFAPDGQTMFSTRHREGESAVVRVPVGGGDPEVLAEGDDLRSLGTVGNSVVIQDGTDIFLTEKPGDRRVIKSDVSEDLDLLVASRTPGEHAVLEARSEGEDGDKTSTWAMIDGTGSSLVEHPELNGFHPVPTDGRSVVLSSVDLTESRDPATGPVTLAVLNASTGVVTTATIPDPAGPSVQQSPDGTVTAVSLRRPESKSPVTLIIGAGTEAETAGQFAGWAPDGSALLVISLVDGQPHAMVASLDGKVQTDLGPAFNAVWVPE